jgi:hypothetical protein
MALVGRRPIVPTGRKLVRVRRTQNPVEIYVLARCVGGDAARVFPSAAPAITSEAVRDSRRNRGKTP